MTHSNPLLSSSLVLEQFNSLAPTTTTSAEPIPPTPESESDDLSTSTGESEDLFDDSDSVIMDRMHLFGAARSIISCLVAPEQPSDPDLAYTILEAFYSNPANFDLLADFDPKCLSEDYKPEDHRDDTSDLLNQYVDCTRWMIYASQDGYLNSSGDDLAALTVPIPRDSESREIEALYSAVHKYTPNWARLVDDLAGDFYFLFGKPARHLYHRFHTNPGLYVAPRGVVTRKNFPVISDKTTFGDWFETFEFTQPMPAVGNLPHNHLVRLYHLIMRIMRMNRLGQDSDIDLPALDAPLTPQVLSDYGLVGTALGAATTYLITPGSWALNLLGRHALLASFGGAAVAYYALPRIHHATTSYFANDLLRVPPLTLSHGYSLNTHVLWLKWDLIPFLLVYLFTKP